MKYTQEELQYRAQTSIAAKRSPRRADRERYKSLLILTAAMSNLLPEQVEENIELLAEGKPPKHDGFQGYGPDPF